MGIRIRHGHIKLSGSNEARISYNGFSGVPSVTATVADTYKNGPNVSLRNVSATGADLFAFYNGGLELQEGTIHWVAVGPTSAVRICYYTGLPCHCDVMYN